MEMDYKISEYTELKDGTVRVIVRFYEGAVTTEDEYNSMTQTMEPVTRYRRTSMFEEVGYTFENASAVNI